MDIAILLLRVVFGGLLVGHGAQKLFGWFGGPGFAGTAGWLESMNLRPGKGWALLAGGSEFVGGALLALGLLTPLGALAVVAAMGAAILLVHLDNGLWNANGGIEFPLAIATVAVAVAVAGPGAYALDAWLGVNVPVLVTFTALALVVLGEIVLLSVRSRGGEGAHEAA